MGFDWRPLIATILPPIWPGFADGPAWITAQVLVESGGRPNAVSPAGAQGLLQLMPDTWEELGPGGDPFDPAENLRRGMTYLKRQWDCLPEVPSLFERMLWAL